MDFNKRVYNPLTGQYETISELDRQPQQSFIPEEIPEPVQSPVAIQPTQPIQPVEPVPAAPLTFKQKAAKRLSLLKPTPKDPMITGSTGPQSSSVPNAAGADDETYFREMNGQPQTMASGLPPQQQPLDAIQQKFDAQRKAIDDLRYANNLANDPELARSKANNDLMSSIFASSLAQQGNTFKQDRTKEIGAIKDSFSAANKSLDSQLTEAERLKAAAGLNEKEGGIAAAQEAELRTVVKDKLGIDLQNTQLKGLELDILVKQAGKDNLDAPVSDVIINQAAKVGITIKPGTTNRQFANDAEFVKTAIANQQAKDLADRQNASLERRERAQAEAKGRDSKEMDKPTTKLVEKVGENVMAAGQGYQGIQKSLKELNSLGLKPDDRLIPDVSIIPGTNTIVSKLYPERARVVNALLENGIRALNAASKVDAAPTERQVQAMKDAILNSGTTVAQMQKILDNALQHTANSIQIGQKQINLLQTQGIGGDWGAVGVDNQTTPTKTPGQPAIMAGGTPGNTQPGLPSNRTLVNSEADL